MYCYFLLSICFILVLYITFYHKLTLALIWIDEIQRQKQNETKQKKMTRPLYSVMMFFIFIVSMTLITLLFPKCNLLGSFVDNKVEVSTSDLASMDCVYVFACVYV